MALLISSEEMERIDRIREAAIVTRTPRFRGTITGTIVSHVVPTGAAGTYGIDDVHQRLSATLPVVAPVSLGWHADLVAQGHVQRGPVESGQPARDLVAAFLGGKHGELFLTLLTFHLPFSNLWSILKQPCPNTLAKLINRQFASKIQQSGLVRLGPGKQVRGSRDLFEHSQIVGGDLTLAHGGNKPREGLGGKIRERDFGTCLLTGRLTYIGDQVMHGPVRTRQRLHTRRQVRRIG